jgi:hypothetical protein
VFPTINSYNSSTHAPKEKKKMGCGKSKLDVASGNTVPPSKKSSAGVDASKVGHEKNGTQANVSKLEEQKKSDENDKPKVVVAPDEISNVQQDSSLEKKENHEANVVENKTQEIVVTEVKEEDSLENDNQPEAAKEEKSPENGKGMQKSLSL